MKKIILFTMLIVLLSSCVTTKIVDEIQLVSSLAFDLADDDLIRGTANVSVHKWQDKIETETISATSKATRDIGYILNTKSAKPIHLGKLSSILVSEELSSEVNLLEIIDAFTRNPTVGRRLYLAITSNTASDLFEIDKTLERDISLNILELLEQNTKRHNIPNTNLHLFLKQIHEVGQTPFLPYLSKVEDAVQVTGIALLDSGKFVHKLTLEEVFTLKVLVEKFSGGILAADLPYDEHVVIRNIKAKSKFKIDKNTNTPNITIDVLIKGTISEYSGEVVNDQVINVVNNTVTKKAEADIKRLITKLQKLKLDPIGIGNRVKSVNRNFNYDEWAQHYENMSFNVNVETIILGHGISK